MSALSHVPALACALALCAASTACMPPSWGAAAILHPHRSPPPPRPALAHEVVRFTGEDGTALEGWLFRASGPRRGVTVVWFHGIADTRASGTWIAERLVPRGFDVLAYDARAHGASGGAACTYGYLEKRDLVRALDRIGARRAVLVGHSLGGAVALQAAAEDPRVLAVVAASSFSDLETVARERAPWFASRVQVNEALAIAEREGGLRVAEASPVAAARRIFVPVLLVHGALDRETPPAHSERIRAALARPGELRLVPDAGHNDVMGKAWPGIEAWIAALFPRETALLAAP